MNAVAGEPAATLRSRHAGPAIAGLVLLIIASALAVTVDVVRTGYGIKGDEATYVSMALSVAYDHDLTYERKDLERFWGLYRSGPEGIFLKRGKTVQIRGDRAFPWLRVIRRTDPNPDRLYFGKAYAYPIAAAPFVRVFGLNGLLLFHVLLLAGVCACGYLFLAQRSSPAAAAVYSTAFVGAAVVPVFAAFLTPEVFNFALVFFAYFLWLYDGTAFAGDPAALTASGSRWRLIAAAVLLGIATYSKPTNALLAAPPVVALWSERRWTKGLLFGVLAAGAAIACFAGTAVNSGELNYQGGDRKTFYAGFPYDSPDGTWDRRGLAVSTNGSAQAEVALEPASGPALLGTNLEYFLIGRHFGFVPYFFPGVVAIGAWLLSRMRRDVARIAIFGAVAVSVFLMLLLIPYTWSGGGGPPGNRYFLSVYPALFFLMPPMRSVLPGVVAWAGGALFTAKMLMNPFVAAKFPYEMTERGAARRLPVEVTMANDLPIMLDPYRSHLPYAQDPGVLLYFLDHNAYTPEKGIGLWIGGGGRADILVRANQPLAALRMTLQSPIHTTVTCAAGGPSQRVELEPEEPVTFDLPIVGKRGNRDFTTLLSMRSSDGFIPRIEVPGSTDGRNLGALVRFTAIPRS